MTKALDWAAIKLVVFDLDGTLYEQRPIRLGMARDLVVHSLRRRSLRDLRAIRHYRAVRESLAGVETDDFLEDLHQEVGARHRLQPHEVAALIEEWMERRPLVRLKAARVEGADALFDALRRSGRRIGVWSDYPVADKLRSLELEADFICSAGDADIRRLKPDPAGLMKIARCAGALPHETLMIGDRAERDGEAARRLQVPVLLRSAKAIPGYATFSHYRDPLFAPVLSC